MISEDHFRNQTLAYKNAQAKFADVIEDLEEELERMKNNTKISQTLVNKRDSQIETLVWLNNTGDELIKEYQKRDETVIQGLGKMPPQAIDLEEIVLGAIMLEKPACMQVINILKPDDFYSQTHVEIFDAMLTLHNNGIAIDMRTVVMQLRKNGKIELVGGAYYIAELTSKVSSAANVEYHARCVMEFSMKRKLIQLASEIHHRAFDDTNDIFELLDFVENEFPKIKPVQPKTAQ